MKETHSMSDEPDTPDVGDQPVVEAPNWENQYQEVEKNYKELQAEFTRRSQRNSELEQALRDVRESDDPDARMRAAQFLGFDIEPEEEETFDDPNQELVAKIAQIEQQLNQRTEQEQAETERNRDLQVIGMGLKAFQDKLGRNLSEEEIQILGDAAMSNRDDDGLPNVTHVTGLFEKAIQVERPRKKAPHVSSGGRQAEIVQRLDDPKLSRQERQDLMYERLQANEM